MSAGRSASARASISCGVSTAVLMAAPYGRRDGGSCPSETSTLAPEEMSVVIDTGEVAPAERFDLWADATPRVFEPLAVRPYGGAPFEGRVARYPLGPLTLYRLTADASRITRTRAMIGASDPEWVQVSLLLGGRCVVDQDGRRSLLRAGDFASWSSSRPYAVDAQSRHDLP